MKKCCEGCEEEWNAICDFAKEGCYVATTTECSFEDWFDKNKHGFIFMVNNSGKYKATNVHLKELGLLK